MNKVFQIGNLTRDPEIRVTKDGKNICTFTMAINSGWKNDEVLFLDVTAWNKTAETCQKYLKKGSKVALDGRLRLEKWKDSNGSEKSKISAVADTVTFLPNAKTQDAESVSPSSTENNKPNPQPKKQKEPEPLPNSPEDMWSDAAGDSFNEDLPF